MTIEVTAPNGSIAEFPDGTSPEAIAAEMTRTFGTAKTPGPARVVARDTAGSTVSVGDNLLEGVTVTAPRKPKRVVSELPSAQPEETTGDFIKGTLGAFGQGVMLNYGDEALAAIITGKTSGPEYEKVRDELRASEARYSQRHPIVSGGAKLAGGIAPFLIPGVGGLAAFRGLGMAGRIAGNIGVGATQGGLSAYGAATDKSSPEAVRQVAEGVVLGGTLAPVAMGVPGALRSVGNMLRPATGDRARNIALDLSTQALQQDRSGLTGRQIAAERAQGIPSGRGKQTGVSPEVRMRQDRALDVPSTYGETVGPSTASLAEQAMMTSGSESGQLLESTIRAQQGARGRVTTTVDDALTRGSNYDVARRDIAQQLRDTHATAYEPAFVDAATGVEREVTDPAILNIINTKTVSPYWAQAGKLAQGDADRLAASSGLPAENPLKDFLVPLVNADGTISGYTVKQGLRPTVRALDYLKRAMDDARDAGFRKGDLSAASANTLKDITKSLTDALDTSVPQYGAARARYAGEAQVRAALDAGAGKGSWSVDTVRPEALRLRLEGDLTRNIAPMSVAEREALRVGYGSKLSSEITSGSRRVNVAGRIVEDPARMSKLGMLFENPAELDAFRAGLEREAQLFAQRGRQLGGSDTARRGVARDAIDAAIDAGEFNRIPAILSQGAAGNWLGVGRTLLSMAQRANGGTEVYEQIANIMRTGTPDEVAQLMQQMAERSVRVAKEASGRARESSAAVRGVDAMLGRSPSVGDETKDPGLGGAAPRPFEETPPAEQDGELPPPPEPPTAQDERASVGVEYDPSVPMPEIRAAYLGQEGTGKNPRSSAVGTGQFTGGTFVGLMRETWPDQTKGLTDKAVEARFRGVKVEDGRAVEDYLLDGMENKTVAMLRSIKAPVNPTNIYLGHFLGQDGAKAALRADPNASIEDVLNGVKKGSGTAAVRANDTLLRMGPKDPRPVPVSVAIDRLAAIMAKRLANVGGT
jgi:hypothetical protein